MMRWDQQGVRWALVACLTIGLALAMGMRIGLLLTLSWMLGLKDAVFHLTDIGLPEAWMGEAAEEMNAVSWRDIIMLVGGLFLVGKSVHEIHEKLEGPHEQQQKAKLQGE